MRETLASELRNMPKKGHERPVHPPIFSIPTSYQRQTVSKPRNVEARNLDSESRRRSGELRN